MANFLSNIRKLVTGNRFRQSFWAYFGKGMKLHHDTDLNDHIETAYEQNFGVFGASNKLATKAASIPLIPKIGDEISEFDPLKEIFAKSKTDYTLKEFRRHFHLFRYLLGESMVYCAKYEGGPDKGKPFQLDIMPPQNVEINYGDIRNIIDNYVLDTGDESKPMKPENVFHSRLFLNVDFDDGKQFRGSAPIAVAADVIRSMNAANKQAADLTEEGSPPYYLVNEDAETPDSETQKQAFIEDWQQWPKNIPRIGTGRMKKIDLGFSTLADLQIVETDTRGKDAMCAIWGVHPALFSDRHATENNILTARKLMYEDRTLPDIQDEIELYNEMFAPFGITYEADLSNIAALQEDKEKMAKVYAIGVDKHAATYNEFRENVLGLDPIDVPEMGEEGLIDRATFAPVDASNFNELDNNAQNNE